MCKTYTHIDREKTHISFFLEAQHLKKTQPIFCLVFGARRFAAGSFFLDAQHLKKKSCRFLTYFWRPPLRGGVFLDPRHLKKIRAGDFSHFWAPAAGSFLLSILLMPSAFRELTTQWPHQLPNNRSPNIRCRTKHCSPPLITDSVAKTIVWKLQT